MRETSEPEAVAFVAVDSRGDMLVVSLLLSSVVSLLWGLAEHQDLVGAIVAGLSFIVAVMWSDTPRRLHIADDGIELSRFGVVRFIAWDAIAAVVLDKKEIHVEQTRPRRFPLRFGKSLALDGRPLPLALLHVRIEETLARHRAARDAPRELEARFRAPTDRDATRWLGDLRALATCEAYRSSSAPRHELAEIVETSADPTARVGAALALRWLGPTEAERSRVAAARVRVADPALGAALDAALEGNDRAAERAALRVRARQQR